MRVLRVRLPSLEAPFGLVVFLGVVAGLVVSAHLGREIQRADETTLPRFLADELGAPEAEREPPSRPAAAADVSLLPDGYAVSLASGHTVSLELVGAVGDEWRRYEGGAFRPTSYGSETITIESTRAEQFLTVERRQGEKTWRWRLDAPGLQPRIAVDGSVEFVAGGELSGFVIPAVSIYDEAGENVTPAGVRWSLTRGEGAWWLELALDDSALPLPYVIDPGIVLRAAASAENGAGAASLTIATPAGAVEGDLLLAQIAVRGGTGVTITAPAGWTLAQDTANGTHLRQAVYWHAAGASEPGSYTWTFSGSQRASGGIVAYGGVETSSPIDVSSANTGNSATATATGVTTTTANAMLVGLYSIRRAATFTPPGGMTERYDVTSSGGGSATAKIASEAADALQAAAGGSGSMAATASASTRWVAHLVALRPDATSPEVTASAPIELAGAGDQFYEAATKIHWFRPSGSGSFSLEATATDSSGVQTVTFPSVAAVSGWAGSTGGDDSSAPYDSPVVYTWTLGAAAPGAQTITGYDFAGNTESDVVTIAGDSAAPSGGSVSYADGWNTTGAVTITTSDGSDTGSGIDASSGLLERSTAPLAGGACGPYGPWTPVASPDAVASGLCAVYRHTVSDNVGNTVTYTSPNVVEVDTSPPVATMLDPGANLGGTVALGSTTADLESGVATVVYEYSPAGTGTWTATPSAWDTTAVPDGFYDLRVTATNAAGLATVSAPVTGRLVDNTAPGGSGEDGGDDAYLRGAVTLSVVPSDPGGSGIASVTFQNRVTGAGSWADIGTDADGSDGWSADWDTTTEPDGDYDLRAVVTDAASNQSTISLGTKTVDNTPPEASVTSGPADPSASDGASFAFASGEPGSTFECRLDGGSFAACTAPRTYTGLADGTHVFQVRATDPAGNTGAPASYGWSVSLAATPGFPSDTAPPGAPRAFGGVVVGGELVLRWTPALDERGAISAYLLYERDRVIVVDGGQLEAKIGPFEPDDAREFSLAAVDGAGNVGPRTPTLRTVPDVAGLSPGAAAAALAARGFAAGPILPEVSDDIAPDLVIRADRAVIAPEGEAIGLFVSSGPAGPSARARLILEVTGPRQATWTRNRFIRIRIRLSRAALVTATFAGPKQRKLVTKRAQLRAGSSVLKLRVPRGAGKPGRYLIRVRARAVGTGKVEQRVQLARAPVRR